MRILIADDHPIVRHGLKQVLASDPAAVIVGEATNGDLCIGHRGRAEIIVEIRGLAGHASAPERARNALEPLPAVLDALFNSELQAPNLQESKLGHPRFWIESWGD